ncbi:MAG: Acetylornithine deacetylase/Succinyl-diaminopimelate desuccinylase and related deacylases [uncultured Rubrobacteraceae bacterium]|uniref:Acetylornithine deacetylase/Succinyl-diaminopimelate desuccinylase and related deacylases n=1 Tax=uncultured Rubrobacteraceae bacterium TaxID=349277 RepID=A0A6J4QWR6_9ACTN|nr:MAG: Acetylornithine deacetylase/Succinyl-diaminopimelate desuccinylase and related deacylases [uncultured Rubrobacteraceae bacterium]
MTLEAALRRADEASDQALETLKKLVAQPSVSTRNEGVQETATLLQEIMEAAGISTRLLPTGGQPAVYGEIAGPPGAPTVLFYGHYDVQPPEPLEPWHAPPFEPTIRNGRIYGRGVADNKGQHLCHILAVRAWREAVGELPVTVKFLIEGEEEIGSPHLADLVRVQRDLLRADLVYTSDGGMHPSGRPAVYFGVRGLLYVELEIRGASADAHSGNKGNVLPQPAWELVDLLHSLRGPDGRAAFPGFYDSVRSPTPKEQTMLQEIPFDRQSFLSEHGLDESSISDGADYHRRLTFEPTFNIAGLASGYAGEGTKTIIPARAIAKIDFRLVADQDPDAIFEAFARAVAERNPSAEVRRLAATPPSLTDPSLRASETVIGAVRDSRNVEPVISALGGTLPDYVFTQILGVPSTIVPYANHDEQNHAPNENLRLDCFFSGIRTTLHVLDALRDLPAKDAS